MFSSDLLLLILQIYIKSPILSISMNLDLGAIVFFEWKVPEFRRLHIRCDNGCDAWGEGRC